MPLESHWVWVVKYSLLRSSSGLTDDHWPYTKITPDSSIFKLWNHLRIYTLTLAARLTPYENEEQIPETIHYPVLLEERIHDRDITKLNFMITS